MRAIARQHVGNRHEVPGVWIDQSPVQYTISRNESLPHCEGTKCSKSTRIDSTDRQDTLLALACLGTEGVVKSSCWMGSREIGSKLWNGFMAHFARWP